MTRYAIDAPTLLHLVTDRVSVDPGHQLVAPNSIRTRALDLLYQRVRAGELADRAASDRHRELTEIKLRLLGDRVSRATAWRIAAERGWDSLADAEYLAVAVLQADFFVSVDRAMVSRATGIVAVAPVAELGVPGR